MFCLNKMLIDFILYYKKFKLKIDFQLIAYYLVYFSRLDI